MNKLIIKSDSWRYKLVKKPLLKEKWHGDMPKDRCRFERAFVWALSLRLSFWLTVTLVGYSTVLLLVTSGYMLYNTAVTVGITADSFNEAIGCVVDLHISDFLHAGENFAGHVGLPSTSPSESLTLFLCAMVIILYSMFLGVAPVLIIGLGGAAVLFLLVCMLFSGIQMLYWKLGLDTWFKKKVENVHVPESVTELNDKVHDKFCAFIEYEE